MKKFIIALLAIAFIGFGLSTASATGFKCPPGQEKKGWKCVDIEVPDSGTTINNTNNNDNKNTNLNTNFNTLKNDVDVDVENKNSNFNTNINSNKQGQDQDQAQVQGQIQGQAQLQGQTAHNEGVEQSITINEADIPVTYTHIAAPSGKTDANMENHDNKSTVRTMSSIFKYDDDAMITMAEAKKASFGADITVKKSLLREANVQLKELNWEDKPTGVYLGSFTLITEDATLDQMLAQAAEEAMLAGATGAIFYAMDSDKLEAVKYGIDFGTAASVAVNATGSAVLAPGSSLGWSKAKSDNMVVPEVYVVIFHDVSLIQ